MLTLGTGVGGGLILDGKPYRGATGSGAELGHIVLDPDGPPVLAAAAAATSRRSPRDPPPTASRASSRRGVGRARPRRAARGRAIAEALEALARIGRHLGAGIASLVNIFKPELVVIGGGFGAAGDLLLEPAREVLAGEALAPARDPSVSSRPSSARTPA